MRLAAVIPCGGRSERMKDALNGVPSKLFLETKDGVPIIAFAVLAMLDAVDGGPVVVVVPLGLEDAFREKLSNLLEEGELARVHFTSGGATRKSSVYNGLELLGKLGSPPQYVLIHDGARPFVRSEEIVKLLRESLNGEGTDVAATLAVPVTSTIKRARAHRDGTICVTETLPRGELWEIQTPQLFSFDLLITAHRKFRESDIEFTDDCQLVEAHGKEVTITLGDRSNIKVTSPGDLCKGR